MFFISLIYSQWLAGCLAHESFVNTESNTGHETFKHQSCKSIYKYQVLVFSLDSVPYRCCLCFDFCVIICCMILTFIILLPTAVMIRWLCCFVLPGSTVVKLLSSYYSRSWAGGREINILFKERDWAGCDTTECLSTVVGVSGVKLVDAGFRGEGYKVLLNINILFEKYGCGRLK